MITGEITTLNDYTTKLNQADYYGNMIDKKKTSYRFVIYIASCLLLAILIFCPIFNIPLVFEIVGILIVSLTALATYWRISLEIHELHFSFFTLLSSIAIDVLSADTVDVDIIATIAHVHVLSGKYYNNYNFFEGD